MIPDELDFLIGEFDGDIDALMTKVEEGEIDVDDFQTDFEDLLAEYQLAAIMAGVGNDTPNDTIVSAAEQATSGQVEYLDNFHDVIDEGIKAGEEHWPLWRARAHMYADSITPTFWTGRVSAMMGMPEGGVEAGLNLPSVQPGPPDTTRPMLPTSAPLGIYLPLPAMPGDGTSQCWSHCKCGWDIIPIDKTKGNFDCYWRLGAAEHCQTCKERAVRWNPLIVRNWDIEMPSQVEASTMIKEAHPDDLAGEIVGNLLHRLKGGRGSGFYGHAGRPGKVGGSAVSGNASAVLSQIGTDSFKKWFGESVVVNSDGTPKVMYHGTHAGDFYKFDPNKEDSTALMGPGFYFTDNPDVSSGYASGEGSGHFRLNRPVSVDDLPSIEAGLQARYDADYKVYKRMTRDLMKKYGKDDGWTYRMSSAEAEAYYALQNKLTANRNLVGEDINGVDQSFFIKSSLDEAKWMTDSLTNPSMESNGLELFYVLPSGIVSEIIPTLQPSVYPVYLSIKHPFDMEKPVTEEEASRIFDVAKKYNPKINVGMEDIDKYRSGSEFYTRLKDRLFYSSGRRETSSVDQATNVFKLAGFDGIYYKGGHVMGGVNHNVFVAFDPGQIKSATGNTGEFSPDNSDITKETSEKGGHGSGDFGHAGRPGRVGGSAGGSQAQAGLVAETPTKANEWVSKMDQALRDTGSEEPSLYEALGQLSSRIGFISPTGRVFTNSRLGIHMDWAIEAYSRAQKNKDFQGLSTLYRHGYVRIQGGRNHNYLDLDFMWPLTHSVRQMLVDYLTAFPKTMFAYEIRNAPADIKNSSLSVEDFFKAVGYSEKGGKGSGDFGHAGRPGRIGGSVVSGGAHAFSFQEGSPAFKAWFSGSKVVNADGTPMEMYHGTVMGDFSSFDPSKADPYAMYGPGFYFTNDPEIGSSYAKAPRYSIVLSRPINAADLTILRRVIPPKISELDAEVNETQDRLADESITPEDRATLYGQLNHELATMQMLKGMDWKLNNKLYSKEDTRSTIETMLQEPESKEALEGVLKNMTFNEVATETPTVFPVYLSIKNPFDVDKEATPEDIRNLQFSFDKSYPNLYDFRVENIGYLNKVTFGDIYSAFDQAFGYKVNNSKAELIKILKNAGYDGIKYPGGKTNGGKNHTVYVAFDSGQIKSYTGNTGTFDPNNPDITKEISEKGGPGSGDFGHSGRPGRVGGSASQSGIRMGMSGSEYMEWKNPDGLALFDKLVVPAIDQIKDKRLKDNIGHIITAIREVYSKGKQADGDLVMRELVAIRQDQQQGHLQKVSDADWDVINKITYNPELDKALGNTGAYFYTNCDYLMRTLAYGKYDPQLTRDLMQSVTQMYDVSGQSLADYIDYRESKPDHLPAEPNRYILTQDRIVIGAYDNNFKFHTFAAAGYILTHSQNFESHQIELARQVILEHKMEDSSVEQAATGAMDGIKVTREDSRSLDFVWGGGFSGNTESHQMNVMLKSVQHWVNSGFIPDHYQNFEFGGVYTFPSADALLMADHFTGDYPAMLLEQKERQKGGAGSGYFGHAGRPGKVGGSSGGGVHPGMVNNDAFKTWFGNSKVVDANGDPRVVYHGTREDFSEFSPDKAGSASQAPSGKLGYFFAGRSFNAESYTNFPKPEEKTEHDAMFDEAMKLHNSWARMHNLNSPEAHAKYQRADELFTKAAIMRQTGGNIKPVYLRLENPLVYDMKGKAYREESFFDIITRAKNAGNDGVIIKNTFDAGNLGDGLPDDVFVAFKPTQIKSVFNEGTYDPNNPNISKEKKTVKEIIDSAVGLALSGIELFEEYKGGTGSGYFGHAGRPGKVGGSSVNGAMRAFSFQEGSPEFQAWFSGSKVVNVDGTPMEMYHGTKAGDISGFDPTMEDRNALYGPGFYFTSDPGVAGEYAKEPNYKVVLSRPITGADIETLDNALPDIISNLEEKHQILHNSQFGLASRKMTPEQRQALVDELNKDRIDINQVEGLQEYVDYYNKNGTEMRRRDVEEQLKNPHVTDVASGILTDIQFNRVATDMPTVYPVYLSIKNPFDVEKVATQEEKDKIVSIVNEDNMYAPEHFKRLYEVKNNSKSTLDDLYQAVVDSAETQRPKETARNVLRTAGYDGIKYPGGVFTGSERRHTVYVAFDPGQIKSYTGNTGTFDPNNPDITKEISEKGGQGSGYFGHAGRPGKVGGSAGGGAAHAGIDYAENYNSDGVWGKMQEAIQKLEPDGNSIKDSFKPYFSNIDRYPSDYGLTKFFNGNLINKKRNDWCGAKEAFATIEDSAARAQKKANVEQIYKQLNGTVDRETISRVFASWAHSSNDTRVSSLSLQGAASDEFGIPLSDWEKEHRISADREAILYNYMVNNMLMPPKLNKDFETLPTVSALPDATQAEWESMLNHGSDPDNFVPVTDRATERKVLRAIYDNTQKKLNSRLGYKKDVLVYRGVDNVNWQRGDEGKKVEYHGNPLESWTTSLAVASGFGEKVIAARVPRSKVFSTARSGMGCMREGEVILMDMTDITGVVAYVRGK